MIHKTGNLFDTDATYIGHGVNCQGDMSGGIAKVFRERYPYNYMRYKAVCKDGTLLPGSFLPVIDGQGKDARVVVNLASQNQPGADATYSWLIASLYSVATYASDPDRMTDFGNVIAIPEIGCGIGGLEWDKVEFAIETVEMLRPSVEFEVWHYGEKP